MIISWQSLTAEEFAHLRRSFGECVIPANGVFWRQVRPCFYRPLLPYQEYSPQSVRGPSLAFFGGFQHAVPAQARTNSLLNLLMCENPASYSLGDLDRHERREIKRATEAFTVSLMTEANEFKAQAYPVYRSFYERTKYGYKSERRFEDNFSKWADALFQTPKVIVIGAHKRNRQLGAIGVWCLVEDTLVYSTFFCETESLKMHVTGFMFHTVREAVAGCPAIKQIFVGNYKYSAAKGVDDFYLARGCKLVGKPAWFQLNPLTEFGLKRIAPGQYGRLIGEIKDAPSVIEPGMIPAQPGAVPISRKTKAVESGRIIPPAACG